MHYSLHSFLGNWLVIGTTPQGICYLCFADSPEQANDIITNRQGTLSSSVPDYAVPWIELLKSYEQNSSSSLDMPVSVTGTTFQQKVWQALRKIPVGQTWSYGQLADYIGHPKAVRAVGTACGANPVAIIIPCHRVVGKNNALTGYRWGVERKKKLLEHEKVKV